MKLFINILKLGMGDWTCNCGELNFKNRIECRKCGNNKSMTFEHTFVANTDVHKEDWKCKCGELNFKPRQQCRKCAGSKLTHTFSTPIHYKESDWKCQCNEINFNSRSECRKCGNLRNDQTVDFNY